MNDLGPPKDWQGRELDCTVCACNGLLELERCALGHACVHDRYAKRIDRFFFWNPGQAKEFIDHPYFEVRAVAAKYVDVFHLPQLTHDPDETVRWSAALRLPAKHLLALVNDPHREVRIRVASRLEPHDLVAMIHDPDYYVRQVVSRRLPENLLTLMMRDEDAAVRSTIASRIEGPWLPSMASDTEADVRYEVAKRLSGQQLHMLQSDPDWRVRYEVASRGTDRNGLRQLANDEDELVRDVARGRLGEEAAEVIPLETRSPACQSI